MTSNPEAPRVHDFLRHIVEAARLAEKATP